MEFKIQIDVKKIEDSSVLCILSNGDRDVRIRMSLWDYETLTKEGFFIRPLDSQADGAGCLNTTLTYSIKPQND